MIREEIKVAESINKSIAQSERGKSTKFGEYRLKISKSEIDLLTRPQAMLNPYHGISNSNIYMKEEEFTLCVVAG